MNTSKRTKKYRSTDNDSCGHRRVYKDTTGRCRHGVRGHMSMTPAQDMRGGIRASALLGGGHFPLRSSGECVHDHDRQPKGNTGSDAVSVSFATPADTAPQVPKKMMAWTVQVDNARAASASARYIGTSIRHIDACGQCTLMYERAHQRPACSRVEHGRMATTAHG